MHYSTDDDNLEKIQAANCDALNENHRPNTAY